MKLIILIIVVMILPEIIAKDVGSQPKHTDKKIVPQKSVILTSNKRKTGSGGPIRRNAKQNAAMIKKLENESSGESIQRNTKQNAAMIKKLENEKLDTNKNELYHPYQKPVNPKVVLSVPHKLKKPDQTTIEDFQELGLSDSEYRGTYASTLDYCAYNIIDPYKRFKKDWRYLPQWLGHGILYYDEKEEKINNKFYEIKLKGKILAMPFARNMNGGHSVCLIVDMNLKTVEYYDAGIQGPADDYEYYCTAGMEFFILWKRALKRRNLKSEEKIDLNGWKFIQPKFKTRRQIFGVDPPNCSIYVLMFIDGRLNGDKRVIKSDNPVKVRKALYKVFMQNVTEKPSKFKIF